VEHRLAPHPKAAPLRMGRFDGLDGAQRAARKRNSELHAQMSPSPALAQTVGWRTL
jgi:hypothetical protein